MLLQLSGEKEAADTKEEYENEADVNLSGGFLPIKLLIRITKKFDLQHLHFDGYQLLTIPMKLTITLIGKIVPEDNRLNTFPITIKESYNVHSLNVSDSCSHPWSCCAMQIFLAEPTTASRHQS